ncbi:MAG: galactose oxidase-like domain-containing protein [Sciscionella sp.]
MTLSSKAVSEGPASPETELVSVNRAQVGQWGTVFPLPNVAIHTHVLPSGKVLFWGRRDRPSDSLNEHVCTPQVWDPATGTTEPTPQPTLADGATVNVFCSGHTFLPDGRLLVAGGHLADSNGVNQACVYDYASNTWTALPVMNGGRWYPTATTLADGRVVVMSGSTIVGGRTIVNSVPQIWDGARWQDTATFVGLPLYPRVHVVSDGRVFMSGSNAATAFLDTSGTGTWTPLPGPGGLRPSGDRQYAPSVQYEPDKVIYIGGGNDAGTDLPGAGTDLIDLGVVPPAWHAGPAMAFRRRQHNATILPDGTVLVTGGTSGPGFNDLSPGKPVHVAELWDPATGAWRQLAAEDVDRCYHSTAVLLPDATVLSAGGGEFVNGTTPNDPKDTHRDGQIFHPPYLFNGPRPTIVSASPIEIANGASVAINVTGPEVAKVTLVRLPSVTHAFDVSQRLHVLAFSTRGSTVTATIPTTPAVCLPGHYMLFVLSPAGVPSVAQIVRVLAPSAPGLAPSAAQALQDTPAPAVTREMTTQELDQALQEQPPGTPVTVGLTAKCPYGLGACWGGAYEALSKLDEVAAVRPIPNTADSTAEVYLNHDGLPDVARWPEQIARWANGSYDYRGVEVTITGTLTAGDETPNLAVSSAAATIDLQPLRPGAELAWDLTTQQVKSAPQNERDAYQQLLQRRQRADADLRVRVTGPLQRTSGHWTLLVRTFDVDPEVPG